MKTCNSCQRYVHNNDETCPFCTSSDFESTAPSPALGRGVSRARVFAARAAIASAAFSVTTACGDDSGQDDMTTQTGGQANTGGDAQATGGDAQATGGDAQATGGDAQAIGGDVGIPIYGGPFPDMMKARV